MNKMKVLKTSLLAATLLPIGAISSLENNASEIVMYDLPGIDQKPTKPEPEQPVEPKPDTKPNPDQGTGGETTPSEKPDTKPEPSKPAPPVHVPTITSKDTFDNVITSPNIIVRQSEIDSLDLLTTAGVTITKTTQTFSDGVLTGTTKEVVTPNLVNQPTNSLGVQTISYSTNGTDKTWSFNINVVNDNMFINADRFYAIDIKQQNVVITQSEAQQLTTADSFINLNGVSGIDATGKSVVIAMPIQSSVNDIASGKVGKYSVEYGISINSRETTYANTFTAQANIEVVADPKQPVVEKPQQVEGLVDGSQLKGDTGNQVAQSEVVDQQKTLRQGGTYTPQTGVNTSTVVLLSTIAISACMLMFIKRK